jgi:hypothetical protein
MANRQLGSHPPSTSYIGFGRGRRSPLSRPQLGISRSESDDDNRVSAEAAEPSQCRFSSEFFRACHTLPEHRFSLIVYWRSGRAL